MDKYSPRLNYIKEQGVRYPVPDLVCIRALELSNPKGVEVVCRARVPAGSAGNKHSISLSLRHELAILDGRERRGYVLLKLKSNCISAAQEAFVDNGMIIAPSAANNRHYP